MTATQTLSVNQVASVFNGKTPSKAQQRESGHPVLKIKDVDELGRFRGTFSGHIEPELAEKHTKQRIVGGETLILNAAHNATHVASKTYYADGEVAGSLATGEWLMIRWNKDATDQRYGNHWINTPETRFRLRQLVNGIHLYPKDVARLQIPLPPLAEQKRIAGILDAADALRARRRESLAQLDTLLQSTFLDMFGDPVTNPMEWEELSIIDLCESSDDVRCGPFGTQLHQHEFRDSGVPLWGIKHVNAGFAFPTDEFISDTKAASLSQYSIMPGDLVMTRKGTIGNCYIYPSTLEPGIMHSDLLRLRLSPVKADAQFVCSQFTYSRNIQRQLELMSPGAVMPGINVTKLKKLEVEAPPLSLQRRFAAIVESVEQQKASQRAHLAELDTLFASLQSRAFRGEL